MIDNCSDEKTRGQCLYYNEIVTAAQDIMSIKEPGMNELPVPLFCLHTKKILHRMCAVLQPERSNLFFVHRISGCYPS